MALRTPICGRFGIERTCMPAGQGAGAIHDVPAAGDLVRSVVAEAEAVLRRIGALPAS